MFKMLKYFEKEQVIACNYHTQWTARKGPDKYGVLLNLKCGVLLNLKCGVLLNLKCGVIFLGVKKVAWKKHF